jgi:hypothetical protein
MILPCRINAAFQSEAERRIYAAGREELGIIGCEAQ